MKAAARIFCFLLLCSCLLNRLSAQEKYEKQWKKVNTLAKKNRPASALKEVKKIYAKAKEEQQDAHIIKSLVYISGFQKESRENNSLLSIQELEKEISNSREPATSILKSILAEVYWNYYETERYRLYNRTFSEDSTDFYNIATWTTKDFHNRISELYLSSIANESLLRSTSPDIFDVLIVKGNTRTLRPTLYDILANRALSYFKNDERDIYRPSYLFQLEQAEVFAPAEDFIKLKITADDTASMYYKALLLFQQLMDFHLHDNPPGSLIDLDIKRLAFVKSKSVHADKEQLYLSAIQRIADEYDGHPVAEEAWYIIANAYNKQAEGYDPFGDTTHRYAKLKAKDICEKVISRPEGSEGWANCYNLLRQMKLKEINLSIENVNIPGQPMRASVSYCNVPKIYLRVIPHTEALKARLQAPEADFLKIVSREESLRNWEQALPASEDMQAHRTEIKIDALPAGEYVLAGSTTGDFTDTAATLFGQVFYVSRISYVSLGNNFFLLDRENGQPLAGATVKTWERTFNYDTRIYSMQTGPVYTTDANGRFQPATRIDTSSQRRHYSFLMDITHRGDRLFMDDEQTDYYQKPKPDTIPAEKKITSIFFFTDRSIYRPGQTVHFKTIVVTTDEKEKRGRVESSFSFFVFLRDANNTVIDSIPLTSSEFGSANGRFHLPASALTGIFTIQTNKGGSTGFRVEEYKKPTFFIEFEPLKGKYKINDTIQVTGLAKAFAGNVVDGAIVKYRVERVSPSVYDPGSLLRVPYYRGQEIAHGTVATDEKGKFIISFKAIPHPFVLKSSNHLFDYRIHVDITDPNGETRSNEKNVFVGYQSVILTANIPTYLPVDSLHSLDITTTNTSGEFEPAVITVSFTRLQEERRLIRDRYWDRPDQFVMSKEEYTRYFPHDEYDEEVDFATWPKLQKVFERTDSVKKDRRWFLPPSIDAGYYMVEIATKDSYGETVKDVRYIHVYNDQPSDPRYIWSGRGSSAEPGEIARVHVATSVDSAYIVQYLDKEKAGWSFFTLHDQKREIDIPVTEDDRGGFGIGWVFIKHNRVHTTSSTIQVPWTNKDLSVEYLTYRDKTMPGSKETWKVRISGNKKETVAAEMLASMYDLSLNQFYPHEWDSFPYWYKYSNRIFWKKRGFISISSNGGREYMREWKEYRKQYDILFATFVYSPYYEYYQQPLWWVNPLGYAYEEMRNPRLMRLPKPVFSTEEEARKAMRGKAVLPDSDGDGVTDQFDQEMTPPGCPVDNRGIRLDSDGDGIPDCEDKSNERTDEAPKVRRNFNETAFFYPTLQTDSSGMIEFSFTLPESLTRWKFMALAHTKDAAIGITSKEIVTQKKLMVQPNMPRFVRQNDKIVFSSKLANLSTGELKGQAELQLLDAATLQPVNMIFDNKSNKQPFTVKPGQSTVLKFPLQVPSQFSGVLTWRVIATTSPLGGAGTAGTQFGEGAFSDGEENSLPVLENRILVTETIPLQVKGNATREFRFEKLLQDTSSTLRHQSLVAEFTSNPVWYAIQSLPYLVEYPYECAEQTWNRYYAHSLAKNIMQQSPRIKQVLELWRSDTSALMSQLEKNPELKSLLLQETPWVTAGKNESQQKKNIAIWFDDIRINYELTKTIEKLKELQSTNGGFTWFKGGPDDRYITQYIITGIAHLVRLRAVSKEQQQKLNGILDKALGWLDQKIREDYLELKKNKEENKDYTPDELDIQYLCARSTLTDHKIMSHAMAAYNYFYERATKTWMRQNKLMQGMIALIAYRAGDIKTASGILISLKERAIVNEEMGMYWKQDARSWLWYESPIETQALLIEAFQEVKKDYEAVTGMRTWLLRNRQTNNWKTTIATAEACYALLLEHPWMVPDPVVNVKLGNTTINSTDYKQEEGSGYFKTVIPAEKINPGMGNITVTVSQPVDFLIKQPVNLPTYGNIYWQYFENIDKITTAHTPLKLVKKLFVEKNTDHGPVLTPVRDGDVVKIGDKIKVRVELTVDRDMEYVHMKDMRASALEPVNVLSSYKWQGGLGYYESTRDASTNFFFNYLRKGSYVFEYPLFVTHAGDFSNGITTIQCMYAPEFTAHSGSVRIRIE